VLDVHPAPIALLVAGQAAQAAHDRVAGDVDETGLERELDEPLGGVLDLVAYGATRRACGAGPEGRCACSESGFG
jgi:hypothetical protein